MAEKNCLARVAVDPVLFTIHDHKLKILLHKREKNPFEGWLELPGGLIGENEDATETLIRKLAEMTGHKDIFSSSSGHSQDLTGTPGSGSFR
jgi:ADP-ribose pyrophosphatase YjhB (NUDIX family)